MSRTWWVALAAFGAALYFGVQGGEYGTLDLWRLRRDETEERPVPLDHFGLAAGNFRTVSPSRT